MKYIDRVLEAGRLLILSNFMVAASACKTKQDANDIAEAMEEFDKVYRARVRQETYRLPRLMKRVR